MIFALRPSLPVAPAPPAATAGPNGPFSYCQMDEAASKRSKGQPKSEKSNATVFSSLLRVQKLNFCAMPTGIFAASVSRRCAFGFSVREPQNMYNIAAVLHCGTVPQMFSNVRDAPELRGYPGAPRSDCRTNVPKLSVVRSRSAGPLPRELTYSTIV